MNEIDILVLGICCKKGKRSGFVFDVRNLVQVDFGSRLNTGSSGPSLFFRLFSFSLT